MHIWDIVCFPSSGEKDSPQDILLNLADKREGASVIHRLETLSKLEIKDWPRTWTKKIGDEIWQLTAGNYRVLYCLDHKTIVVLHICRKKRQKAGPQDTERARIHHADYMAQKRGG